jgi:hypothetical protein
LLLLEEVIGDVGGAFSLKLLVGVVDSLLPRRGDSSRLACFGVLEEDGESLEVDTIVIIGKHKGYDERVLLY